MYATRLITIWVIIIHIESIINMVNCLRILAGNAYFKIQWTFSFKPLYNVYRKSFDNWNFRCGKRRKRICLCLPVLNYNQKLIRTGWIRLDGECKIVKQVREMEYSVWHEFGDCNNCIKALFMVLRPVVMLFNVPFCNIHIVHIDGFLLEKLVTSNHDN